MPWRSLPLPARSLKPATNGPKRVRVGSRFPRFSGSHSCIQSKSLAGWATKCVKRRCKSHGEKWIETSYTSGAFLLNRKVYLPMILSIIFWKIRLRRATKWLPLRKEIYWILSSEPDRRFFVACQSGSGRSNAWNSP